jgi:hypothetical protein
MYEVGCGDAVGVRGQKLPPGQAIAAGRRIDLGVMQDLLPRGGRDPVAELDELALCAPVGPGGICPWRFG